MAGHSAHMQSKDQSLTIVLKTLNVVKIPSQIYPSIRWYFGYYRKVLCNWMELAIYLT